MAQFKKNTNFAPGEMAEWSIAAVLKTVEGQTSGGSNPSLSAKSPFYKGLFLFSLSAFCKTKNAIRSNGIFNVDSFLDNIN